MAYPNLSIKLSFSFPSNNIVPINTLVLPIKSSASLVFLQSWPKGHRIVTEVIASSNP